MALIDPELMEPERLMDMEGLHPVPAQRRSVYFWMNAHRMLQCEGIYLHFFQFTPPGADLVYLGFFKLFFPHTWVTNAVVLVLGVILCRVCYEISKLIMGRLQALLATSFFLVLIYGKLLNGIGTNKSVCATWCRECDRG